AAFPADAQTPHPVVPGDGALDDPSDHAEPGAVISTALSDLWVDPFVPQLVTVFGGVIGAVGVQRIRSLARTSTPTAHRRDGLDQWEELGDVVGVAGSQAGRQRNAATVGDHMVLGAWPGAVDWARAAFGPRRIARACELSITARDQSSAPAAFSSAKSASCSRCHTPASFHSASRRQQVIPDPNPSSWGRNSHWIPVCSTNRMPCKTSRSGSRLRPNWGNAYSQRGNSGSIRSHSSSGTIHGGCSPFLTPS